MQGMKPADIDVSAIHARKSTSVMAFRDSTSIITGNRTAVRVGFKLLFAREQ